MDASDAYLFFRFPHGSENYLHIKKPVEVLATLHKSLKRITSPARGMRPQFLGDLGERSNIITVMCNETVGAL